MEAYREIGMKGREKVLCAAIHYLDGKAHPGQIVPDGFVLGGYRHGDVMLVGIICGLEFSDDSIIDQIQGFITSKGRFVDSREGARVAFSAGQIKYYNEGQVLISEELY